MRDSCLCGYVHETEFVSDRGARYYKTIEGDEPFKEIEGQFTTEVKRDYSPNGIEQLTLKACPKCGTVKVKSNGW